MRGAVSKKVFFGLGQLLIVFLVGLYIESVSGERLIFFDKFLNEKVCADILNNEVWVIVILGLINVFLYIFSHAWKQSQLQREVYNNICEAVFNKFIKENKDLENSEFRVSIFKASNPWYRKSTILKNVGRHQTRQEKKLSEITFKVKEGIVGQCYFIGEIMTENLTVYTGKNLNGYFKLQEDKLGLSLKKAKKLNEKPCSYLACPIKYHGSDELHGAVVVDSLKKTDFKSAKFRDMEKVVNFSSIFLSNN